MCAEHHRGEDEEEEALKAQEYEEDDCCWRREGTALWGMEGHGKAKKKNYIKNYCSKTRTDALTMTEGRGNRFYRLFFTRIPHNTFKICKQPTSHCSENIMKTGVVQQFTGF